MTIRMYLILVFATILAFAGVARAEQLVTQKQILIEPLPVLRDRLNFDFQKYKYYKIPPQGEMLFVRPTYTYEQVLVKLTEEQIQDVVLERLKARAQKTKLTECDKAYEFDYFSYAASGNSLFHTFDNPEIQAEQQRLYRQLQVYVINGRLTKRDPAAEVPVDVAVYCETFASAQADVLAVQVDGVSSFIQVFGGGLEAFGKFMSGNREAN